MFTYGTLQIDGDKLPAQSVTALVKRGISHFLGNEQAAKVGPSSKWYKDFLEANKVAPTDEECDAQKLAFQEAAIVALYAGEIGASTRGPKVDPVTAAMQSIARVEVTATLKANGIKVPKGDEAVEFSDGTKLTMADMIERRTTKYGDRIRKEAEKRVAADVAKAKKAQEQAASRGDAPLTLDAIDI